MKLLFTKRGYGPIGGSESLAYQFATRLAARGHDVRVVCAWPSEKEKTRYRGGSFSPTIHDDHRVFRDRGVEVVQVRPRGGILGMAADATTLVDLMRGDLLERYAQDRELIHNVGREYLDSSIHVAEELALPLVLTPLAHPGQFHGGDAPSDLARYQRASALTTMTDWERDWYVGQGIDPTRVITTGMGPNATGEGDAKRFRAAHHIPPHAPIVLFIGRKERYKGFIQLLDASETVWRTHPDTRFVFIGVPGFYSAFFDDFARYHDERIVHLENARAATKADALEACSLFAMPSLHETFGLGYLEAWLHSKPVIGGDIPAIRDVIDDGVDGICVRQRADAVAAAVLQLLDDPAAAAAMGRQGREKVHRRWSWDTVIDRVEMSYARAAAAVATAA
ncbi:MAG TPA: glycosyltransferase family 4 protein [Candidatus Saccharimonadales bacterium]|nr:glycosyltransferase family 4 protein [Candidatus Saccharimonadales bacterium]